MPIDRAAIARGVNESTLSCHRYLCRTEIDAFTRAAGEAGR